MRFRTGRPEKDRLSVGKQPVEIFVFLKNVRQNRSVTQGPWIGSGPTVLCADPVVIGIAIAVALAIDIVRVMAITMAMATAMVVDRPWPWPWP